MEFLLGFFLFPFVLIFLGFSARQCLSVFVSSLPACFRDGRSFPVSLSPTPAHCLALPFSKQWQKSSTCWEDLQPYFCQRKNADECSFVIFISIPITAFFFTFSFGNVSMYDLPVRPIFSSLYICLSSLFFFLL